MKRKIILILLSIISHTFLPAETILSPGDIQFLSFRSDSPDAFSIVIWKEISDSTQIGFTDNGWAKNDSIGFSNQSEGLLMWTYSGSLPLKPGSVVNFSCLGNTMSANYGNTIGSLCGLSTSGDQVFAFQGQLDSCKVLAGIHFEGNGWQTDRQNSNTSAEPYSIMGSLSSLAMAETDNARCMSFRMAHPFWQYQIWNADLYNSWIFENDGSNMPAQDSTSFEMVGAEGESAVNIDSIWINTAAPRSIRLGWNATGSDSLLTGYFICGVESGNKFRPSDLWIYTVDSDMSDYSSSLSSNDSNGTVRLNNIPPGKSFVFSVVPYSLKGGFPFYHREKTKRLQFHSLNETMNNQLLYQDTNALPHPDNGAINGSNLSHLKKRIISTETGLEVINLEQGDLAHWEIRNTSGHLVAEYFGNEFSWSGEEYGLILINLSINNERVEYKKLFFP